jgi:hypothetical protein
MLTSPSSTGRILRLAFWESSGMKHRLIQFPTSSSQACPPFLHITSAIGWHSLLRLFLRVNFRKTRMACLSSSFGTASSSKLGKFWNLYTMSLLTQKARYRFLLYRPTFQDVCNPPATEPRFIFQTFSRLPIVHPVFACVSSPISA